MHFPSILPLLALLPSALAAGRAIVTNQCDTPIYLWSVGATISPPTILRKDTTYSELLHRDPQSGGIAIKISSVQDGIYKPNVSQTIFAYNLDDAGPAGAEKKVWYDLTTVFGDGFAGSTVKVKPSVAVCREVVWPYGVSPKGSQVASCAAEADLELSFCSGRCLPSWSPCGRAAPPGDNRVCCTHCIGSHHCVAPPSS